MSRVSQLPPPVARSRVHSVTRMHLATAQHIEAQADKPFFGICLGLQLLFDGGDENGGVEGLGLIPGRVGAFDPARGLPVPHIGWNTICAARPSRLLAATAPEERVYFVHSYRATPSAANEEWALATAEYGEQFLAVVSRGNVHACQFHPEKSGSAGQAVLRSFLELEDIEEPRSLREPPAGAGQVWAGAQPAGRCSRRACGRSAPSCCASVCRTALP
jgi:imidazole glycerol phosphate synthase glutamine amidotransferase subunit